MIDYRSTASNIKRSAVRPALAAPLALLCCPSVKTGHRLIPNGRGVNPVTVQEFSFIAAVNARNVLWVSGKGRVTLISRRACRRR
jgi:hypothetical protein